MLSLMFRRRWVPAAVCAAAILVGSSLPPLGIGASLLPGCDKILHFIEYSILGITLRYWSGKGRLRFPLGGMAFAAMDEFHQRYVPGREASLWDLVADAGGLVLGFYASARFVRGKVTDG